MALANVLLKFETAPTLDMAAAKKNKVKPLLQTEPIRGVHGRFREQISTMALIKQS